MKVVHISLTSVSSAPRLLMKALHKFSSIQSRWILLLYQSHYSEHDIIYKEENKDFCIELIKEADVLHFHHPINFSSDNNPFGLNLKKIVRKSCKFVFSFHSSLVFYYPQYPISDSINYLISYITNGTKQNIKYTALP